MERLVDALEANDVSVSEIGRAGESSGLPGGNYSVVTLEQIEDYYHTTLAISDFGRVVSRDIGWFQQDYSYDWINDELGLESKKRLLLCQKVITQIGFCWPNENLLRSIVPGLNVHYYGRTDPLRVCELLY